MNSLISNATEEKRQKKGKRLFDFRIWKQQKFYKQKNIIVNANKDQSTIKRYTAELKEEEYSQNKKVRINNKVNIYSLIPNLLE